LSRDAHEFQEDREAIIKAFIAGEDSGSRARGAGETDGATFLEAGALEPPYDPEQLALLVEHSNSLRQNLDAYSVNIDGFGHRYDPAIDLDAEDANDKIRDALLVERATRYGAEAAEPSDDEVAERRTELIHSARLERARLDSFFSFCCFDHSFVQLRRMTRQDLETCGNAYWEVLRNGGGEVARLVYVPAHTVRLTSLDTEAVEVEDRIAVSPVSYERDVCRRRFRRFVQVEAGMTTHFRAFGDPRVTSYKTGARFESVEALRRVDPADGPATELLHFKIPSPRTPYGVPRWIGALLSVIGSRQMEEVNLLYFENKSIPPLALLVSGGRLSKDSVPRIERFIEENIKGKKNFHKILILQAENGAGDSKAKIELHPLTSAQQSDALFQEYDQANQDKVGGAFRLPRILRGESKEVNRATAQAALRFAEDQVFAPERDEFDYFINRKLLSDMGITFWRFRSQTPVTRDPERMTVMVEKLTRVGVLTPEEGRLLAADIFNREFRKLGDDWTKRPLTLTLAGIQTGVEDLRGEDRSPRDAAKAIFDLRDELKAEEERVQKRRLELAREQVAEESPERISVPDDEFDAWMAEE
jgi:PBSX family phage portal protein